MVQLCDVIVSLTATQALTYRAITDLINQQRLFVPRDGLLLATANVRDAVRRHARLFEIDRTGNAHLVRAVSYHAQVSHTLQGGGSR